MERRKFIEHSSKTAVLLGAMPLFNGLSRSGVKTSSGRENELHLLQMKDWLIVVGEDAGPGDQYAACEFQRLFKTITGAELRISVKSADGQAIYIGKSAIGQEHAILNDLGGEGLHIQIDKDQLRIAAATGRGSIYGVYEFFERYIGIHFLTADHTYIPHNAALIPIPLETFRYVPDFGFRCSYYKENIDDPSFATRLRNNSITDDPRLGGKTGQELITHTILTYLPVALYGNEHPEYYALVDGVRQLRVIGGPQVCSTNPEVISIITGAVINALSANPSRTSISVSQMDNNFVCACPVCSALSEKEGSLGAPHLLLVNAIAEKVAISHPGVKIGTLIYRYSRKPPKSIKLLPNVEIMLCSFECCTLHLLDDPHCSRNKLFMEDFSGWKRICDNILIWNYNTNFYAYDLPFPNFHVIAGNVQRFWREGAQGVFMQAAGDGLSTEMSDLRNYVMSRCLWHPTEGGWAIVDQFCRLHYGRSAEPILSYLRFIHKNAVTLGVHPNAFPRPVETGIDWGVAKKIYGYFSEALKLAPDRRVRLRVEKASIPAFRTLLATAPLVNRGGTYQYDAHYLTPEILPRYACLVRKFSMNQVGEKKPASVHLDELSALVKGLPTVMLENKIWRIIILPEQMGRFAQLLHKPTGNYVIVEPRAEDAGISHSLKTKNTWRRESDAVLVSTILEDGSGWTRRFAFTGDQQGIRIDAEYTAGIDSPLLEIHERPCMYSISATEDETMMSVCAKGSEWKQVNRNWQFDMGAVVRQLPTETNCTSVAFYDRSKKFGMRQRFMPGSFHRFFLYWYHGRRELGLEMRKQPQAIRKGEKQFFGYEIDYLTRPPWDDQN